MDSLVERLREWADLPAHVAFLDSTEAIFDQGNRHKSGKKPYDYLISWLSMLRPFAFATKDDSWGEMEKLLCIVMRNYIDVRKDAGLATTELERLTAEVEEQARLNGIGAERELALLAKVERLTAENARLRGLIEPTEANVERVAKKMCCPGTSCVGVDDGDGCRAEYWFEDATAALNALDPET